MAVTFLTAIFFVSLHTQKMSLYVTSLNSGSNGNTYYIGNDTEAVLVDAGISCRETERRMARLGLSMELVKAIFISHEHSDHISGVPTLAKKYQLPIYITERTLRNSGMKLSETLVQNFKADEAIRIGALYVIPFGKHHDAADPHSFVIEYKGVKVGVLTDIGASCDRVVHYFKQCHAAFLEANYDDEMLDKGNYPWHLKQRIRGGRGHLSNAQAVELFRLHKPAFMSHVFLSHLSKNNNTPELAYKAFLSHAGATEIIVASRYEESAIYSISDNLSPQAVALQHDREEILRREFLRKRGKGEGDAAQMRIDYGL